LFDIEIVWPALALFTNPAVVPKLTAAPDTV
jgi:hypothetical protein